MAFKMIVFDWDGTLLDSTGAITHAIRQACQDAALPDPGQEIASFVIGLGLAEALRYAAPSATDEQLNILTESYRHNYLKADHTLRLFAGAVPLLEALQQRNITCTVATGKSRQGLNRAMEQTKTRPFFAGTRCADECHSKPHPEMLHELMEEFSFVPEEVLMIGDTTHDLQMAQAAGTHALAVCSGAHPRNMLVQLPHLAAFTSVSEATPWLLQALDSGVLSTRTP
ncbi:MAG: HAD-IA family hydrolase [Limnobacter sp.]|nr:HAD-IA family hydrolase [Limnobacter sp.]